LGFHFRANDSLASEFSKAGLGSANFVRLAKAHELAASFRAALADGIDPIKTRQSERTVRSGRHTFGDIAVLVVSKSIGLAQYQTPGAMADDA
jgi:hypothetical protein